MRRARLKSSNAASAVESLENRLLFAGVYPTDLEQYMVELINHARANPAAQAALYGIDLNEGLPAGTLSNQAKQPLAINPFLMASATSHTQTMLQTQTFSHTEAGNSSPYDREVAAGYVFSDSWGWGENIAYRSDTLGIPAPDPTARAEEQDLFVDTSITDRGHRLNLLNPAFQEIGVGIQEGVYNHANALMTTEDFAYTTGNSFLTGVAFRDANGNNAYDPGEGLPGVAITAVARGSGIASNLQTWSSGGYSLQLAPGIYDVTASGGALATPITYTNVSIRSQNVEIDFNSAAPPPAQTAPTPISPATTTPAPAPIPNTPTPTPTGSPTATPANPTAAQPASGSQRTVPTNSLASLKAKANGVIRGQIFEDLNDNSHRDAGEIGAPYVSLYLNTSGGPTQNPGEPIATTNVLGQFEFVGIAPGTYHVVVVMPSGWRISTRGIDDRVVKVHRTGAARVAPFFITPTVGISGVLFNDRAGTGSQAPNDRGISGWKVYLDLNGDGVHQPSERAVTTGRRGAWAFGDLPSGTYTIRVIAHRHYVVTTANIIVGPLTNGEVSTDNLIGVHRLG